MGHGVILTIENLTDVIEFFKVAPFRINEDIGNKNISIYFDNVNTLSFRKRRIYKCINYIRKDITNNLVDIRIYINNYLKYLF